MDSTDPDNPKEVSLQAWESFDLENRQVPYCCKILNEEDPKIVEIKQKYGDAVLNDVMRAFSELEIYWYESSLFGWALLVQLTLTSPSGRYPTAVAWIDEPYLGGPREMKLVEQVVSQPFSFSLGQ